ncbi:MAG: hypothetical protein JJE17_00520 [Peptostreptococcaceae bacterium]|nr:hypothetical protein [Peptostreptococcaceae bacterium]
MLIWNNCIIQPYETFHSIASKICFLNFCAPYDLNIDMTDNFQVSSKRFTEPWKNLYSILGDKTISDVKMSQDVFWGIFMNSLKYNTENLLCNEFKVCPKCIETGYHSLLHQLTFMDKCFIHGIKLVTECPKCHSKSFEWIKDISSRAYTCRKCKHIFIKMPIEIFIKSSFNNPVTSIDAFTHTNENKFKKALIISVNINENQGNYFTPSYKSFLFDYIINDKISKIPEFIIPYSPEEGEGIKFQESNLLLSTIYKEIFNRFDNNLSSDDYITQVEYNDAKYYLFTMLWDRPGYEIKFKSISKLALSYIIFYELIGNMEFRPNLKSFNCTQHASQIFIFSNDRLINTFEIYEKLCEDLINQIRLSKEQLANISEKFLHMLFEDIYSNIKKHYTLPTEIKSKKIFNIRHSRLMPPDIKFYSYKLIVLLTEDELHIHLFRQ